jgi:hypothetical protein
MPRQVHWRGFFLKLSLIDFSFPGKKDFFFSFFSHT